MIKSALNQNDNSVKELIDTIEPDFVYSKKPINRFKIIRKNENADNQDKNKKLLDLKKKISSIENCKLKDNSKNLILGDGDIDGPIMLIGEAPNEAEEKSGLPYQGEVGSLLNKMFLAINVKRKKIYRNKTLFNIFERTYFNHKSKNYYTDGKYCHGGCYWLK